MDTERFILSVRERRPLWDQQTSDHHNRYVLDRLWKEISQENSCSVKEAQKKWKGIRDYYRNEFRKTQEKRAGQGSHAVYKPNWPYFECLEFLREQFQARPSRRKISVSEKRAEKRKPDQTEATEVSNDIPDSPRKEQDESNDSDDTLESFPSAAAASTNNETRTFTQINDFRKRTDRQDQIKRLVQLEEKKLSLLEEKKRKLEQKNNSDDEDFKFFESLKPHLKLITGMNKLMFRNDVQNLVMKYAYCQREFDLSSSSFHLSGHGSLPGSRPPSTSVNEGSYTLQPRCSLEDPESGIEEKCDYDLANN